MNSDRFLRLRRWKTKSASVNRGFTGKSNCNSFRRPFDSTAATSPGWKAKVDAGSTSASASPAMSPNAGGRLCNALHTCLTAGFVGASTTGEREMVGQPGANPAVLLNPLASPAALAMMR